MILHRALYSTISARAFIIMGRREQVKELFVVYDADGTMTGEVLYIVKKLLGIGHCAACDITHGPRREKPEFTELKTGGWAVPLHNIHRDEMDDNLREAVNGVLPCVAARTERRDVVLLGPAALGNCSGEVLCLQRLVNDALQKYRLSVPERSDVCRVPDILAARRGSERASSRSVGGNQDAVVPGARNRRR